MALVHDLRDIVNWVHASAWASAIKNGATAPDEPGLISEIVRPGTQNALTAVVNQWPPNAGVYTQLSGTFIHQTPRVTYSVNGTSRTTEIGDLLLIGIDHTNGKGRATLLQAKRTSARKTGALNNGNDDAQFYLYNQWPTFVSANKTFPTKNPRTKSDWDLGKSPETGDYLTVYNGQAYQLPTIPGSWKPNNGPSFSQFKKSFDVNQPHDEASMTIGSPLAPGTSTTAGVDCPHLLGDLLEGLLIGQKGRPFKLLMPSSKTFTDWDCFIHEMLALGAKASYKFNHAANGAKNFPRYLPLAFIQDSPAQTLAAIALAQMAPNKAFLQVYDFLMERLGIFLRPQDPLGFPWPLPGPEIPYDGNLDDHHEDEPGRGFGILAFHMFGNTEHRIPDRRS